MPKDLGSNPSECHIFYLFRCVLSFSATLAKCWKVQFRLGLAINSTTLILITAYQHPKILYYIYICAYDSHNRLSHTLEQQPKYFITKFSAKIYQLINMLKSNDHILKDDAMIGSMLVQPPVYASKQPSSSSHEYKY